MYNPEQNEQEILKYWDEHKIFEKSVNERPENKPYVFYDGPPFATGLPHYGHILGSVIKDVVPRYWVMKGYRVRRRWGWDCHGLPIENLVGKELKIFGKKQIERMGIDKFNEACRSKVLKYTKEWKKMIERIGRWVEFDNAYKTMDSTYMESVWWALKFIWDKGLIYEGRKVLMYCPHCETPVSKAEVAMDDSYQNIIEEAVVVKFQISNSKSQINSKFQISNDKPVYMLAWTTTPWTLPGNVALAVNENVRYWILDIGGEQVIVSRDRVDVVLKGRPYDVVKEVDGSELVGLEYEPLFDIPAVRNSGKKAWYVAPADFVTTEEGTGVVHTAVIYGEDDYNLGLKIDLPMVPLLDEKGVFNKEAPDLIQGQYFKKSEKDIKDDLENRGLIFGRSNHTHSYPHCWRCGVLLFYNAISAWFINIQKIKKRMIELNEKINWYPEHLKRGRFLNILETAPDWNISRNRYWATPLPFWKCVARNQNPCDNVVCVGSVKELKERAINFDEVYATDKVEEMDLHKHLADKIKLRCEKCGGAMSRVSEVVDCWVESGSMPFAEFHYPFENKEVFEKRFPGDYIAEYIAQTRVWFYYMHAMAALLFDDASFKNCVTTGTILNEKGEKLSKSKMNYTDPWKIIERYGVDAIRYYMMTSVVMEADNLFFNDNDVKDAYNKVINILWNVMEFFRMYGNHKSKIIKHKSNNILDKWILSKLQLLVEDVTEGMESYKLVDASRPILDFVTELSQWYVRRSRDRFKKHESRIINYETSGEGDYEAACDTLNYVLLTLSKVMAPFTPFIAEKIYLTLKDELQITSYPPTEYLSKGDKLQESVHLEEWPEVDESLIDKEILEQMDVARKIVEMGLSLRAEKSIRVRQPLNRLQVAGCRLQEDIKYIIAEELNVKSVEIDDKMINDKLAVKEEGDLRVGLDITVTDKLRQEGLAREIVRAINQTRKEKKLTPKDAVTVCWGTDSAEISEVMAKFADEIVKAVKAKGLVRGEKEGMSEVKAGEYKMSVLLERILHQNLA